MSNNINLKSVKKRIRIKIIVANSSHIKFSEEICKLIETSARERGTGIAKRKPTYIARKMQEGKMIIALDKDKFAGSCYIEAWENKQFVANSGLIVHPDYRKLGLARRIKEEAFKLSRTKYPDAKIFGITTSIPTLKINLDLGYKPVPYEKLTKDNEFWNGCKGCVNYKKYLQRFNQKYCLCNGMLFDPKL